MVGGVVFGTSNGCFIMRTEFCEVNVEYAYWTLIFGFRYFQWKQAVMKKKEISRWCLQNMDKALEGSKYSLALYGGLHIKFLFVATYLTL